VGVGWRRWGEKVTGVRGDTVGNKPEWKACETRVLGARLRNVGRDMVIWESGLPVVGGVEEEEKSLVQGPTKENND